MLHFPWTESLKRTTGLCIFKRFRRITGSKRWFRISRIPVFHVNGVDAEQTLSINSSVAMG